MSQFPPRLSRISILLVILLSSLHTVYGQNTNEPTLVLTDEFDIGFDCPEGITLQPDAAQVWVLLDNCFDERYSVVAFDLVTNTLNMETRHSIDGIGYESLVDWFSTPLAFVPDGMLDLIQFTGETYSPSALQIDSQTGEIRTDANADSTLDNLLRQYTVYPEVSIFSADHTLAAARAESSIYVVSLTTGGTLFELNIPSADYGVFPRFSPDNKLLYLAQLNEPDNYENIASTLYVYQLADGTLLQTLEIPGFIFFPSPDGRYIAVLVSDSQLAVVDLTTGGSSGSISIWEAAAPVNTCLNTGNDVSDVDFIWDGELYLTGLQWLPDSSQFITANSYSGDGAGGGGSSCIFSYSRLRRYSVEPVA